MVNNGNTGETYSNSLLINMDKYSIIIPVVYKDYSFLNKTLKYILKYFSPVMLYIITDSRMAEYLTKRVKSCDLCKVIDENHIVEGLSLARIDSIIKALGRHHTKSGWYYQQFLKMGFAMSRYCETDYYLSWDSDTIPLKEIVFFDNDNHPYFTMKSEFHKPYFNTMQRVLSIGKTNPCSYIAEHMMFNKQIMEEMIAKIDSSNVNGNVWFEKILYSLEPEDISPFSFSEFETYGTYCHLFHPELYVERHLNGLRRGGLIQGRFVSERILNSLAEDFDIASFEIYDRPPFPWGVICNIYEKWQNKKEHWLKRKR